MNKIVGGKRVIRNYDNEGNLISKECSCCHKIKSASKFSVNKKAKDGLQFKCKECSKECNKKYRQENKDRIKEYQKEYCQEHYLKNKDGIKEKQRIFRH